MTRAWMMRRDGEGGPHERDSLCAFGDRCQPVVVISPEDREQVERLLRGYAGWADATDDGIENYPRYVDSMQTALRSLLAPPRPPEPMGLGAVVEAVCGCQEGPRRFVRDPDARDFNLPWDLRANATTGAGLPRCGADVPWVSRCGHHAYAGLTAVRVLSEGVTPEATP